MGSQGTKIPKANSAGYSSPHQWDCRANALHYLPGGVGAAFALGAVGAAFASRLLAPTIAVPSFFLPSKNFKRGASWVSYSVAVCSVTSLSSFWWMAALMMSWEACISRSQVDNCCTSFSADLSLDSPRAETSPRKKPRAAGVKREDFSGRAGAAGATPAPHGAL